MSHILRSLSVLYHKTIYITRAICHALTIRVNISANSRNKLKISEYDRPKKYSDDIIYSRHDNSVCSAHSW